MFGCWDNVVGNVCLGAVEDRPVTGQWAFDISGLGGLIPRIIPRYHSIFFADPCEPNSFGWVSICDVENRQIMLYRVPVLPISEACTLNEVVLSPIGVHVNLTSDSETLFDSLHTGAIAVCRDNVSWNTSLDVQRKFVHSCQIALATGWSERFPIATNCGFAWLS